MRNGFELLETRLISDKIDLGRLERENNIIFPPVYRIFVETFKTPLLDSNKFIAYFPDEEVGFGNFSNNIKRVIEIYKSEESYYSFSMFPIISSGIHAGGICVCLKGENKDKIYLDNEIYEGRFQFLANNIFEFVRGIIEVEDGENPSIYKSISKL